jgi:hypothetical protein
MSVPIPIGPRTAKERLNRCTEVMTAVKKSSQAAMQMWVQTHITARLPTWLARKTAHDAFSRHTMVFSNVPGPPEIVRFSGEPVLGIHALFPNLLPQILMLSYGGGVFCNLSIDDTLLEGAAKEIPELYLEELRELAEAYGIEVRGEDLVLESSPGKYFQLPTMQ